MKASSLILAVCLLGVGCGDDAPADEGVAVGETRSDAGVNDAARSDAGVGGSLDEDSLEDAGRGEGSLEDASRDAPTDAATSFEASAIGVISVLNNLVRATSELASILANSDAVRSYADALVASYAAAKDRIDALGITPVQSAAADEFVQMAPMVLQTLGSAAPEAFDRAYLESQVALQTRELEAFDSLLARASTPALESELEMLRSEVASQLQQAKSLLAAL